MLTYKPGPGDHQILKTEDKGQSSCGYEISEPLSVDEPPNLLTGSYRAVMKLVMTYNCKNASHQNFVLYGDAVPESAQLYVGQVGMWQEYRQELSAKAQSIIHRLRSLDVNGPFYPPLHNLETGARTEETNAPDSAQLNFSPHPFYQPHAQTIYHKSVQDELCWQVVRVVLEARTFLENVLANCQSIIRLVSAIIGLLHAVAFSASIFCSVLWEKRRWFLFHGARPPKSTAQAMWTCLPGACSGFPLA